MFRVIISKKQPIYEVDTLFFDIENRDMEDFLRTVSGQGYFITFFEDEKTNE